MEVERRIPLFTLIRHKHLLEHLASFSDPVEAVNFSTSAFEGFKTGKYYISSRTPDVLAKTTLRGVHILNTYRITREDAVLLTKNQYDDLVALLAPSNRC